MKINFVVPDFFSLHAVFNLHLEFLQGSTICILVGMISIPGMFSIPAGVMCILAGTACIPMGTIGNQIPVGDTRLRFFLHTGVKYLPARINFY